MTGVLDCFESATSVDTSGTTVTDAALSDWVYHRSSKDQGLALAKIGGPTLGVYTFQADLPSGLIQEQDGFIYNPSNGSVCAVIKDGAGYAIVIRGTDFGEGGPVYIAEAAVGLYNCSNRNLAVHDMQQDQNIGRGTLDPLTQVKDATNVARLLQSQVWGTSIRLVGGSSLFVPLTKPARPSGKADAILQLRHIESKGSDDRDVTIALIGVRRGSRSSKLAKSVLRLFLFLCIIGPSSALHAERVFPELLQKEPTSSFDPVIKLGLPLVEPDRKMVADKWNSPYCEKWTDNCTQCFNLNSVRKCKKINENNRMCLPKSIICNSVANYVLFISMCRVFESREIVIKDDQFVMIKGARFYVHWGKSLIDNKWRASFDAVDLNEGSLKNSLDRKKDDILIDFSCLDVF